MLSIFHGDTTKRQKERIGSFCLNQCIPSEQEVQFPNSKSDGNATVLQPAPPQGTVPVPGVLNEFDGQPAKNQTAGSSRGAVHRKPHDCSASAKDTGYQCEQQQLLESERRVPGPSPANTQQAAPWPDWRRAPFHETSTRQRQ